MRTIYTVPFSIFFLIGLSYDNLAGMSAEERFANTLASRVLWVLLMSLTLKISKRQSLLKLRLSVKLRLVPHQTVNIEILSEENP